MAAQEQHERRHLEGPRAADLLDSRQRRLGELHMAARAPRDHLPGFAVRKLVHGALRLAPGCLDVAGAHLHDAAAVGGAAHHRIGDAERIHDVEGQERDVRGLEHIASGVEDEVRRRGSLWGGPLAQPAQQLVIELQARYVCHLARNPAKTLDPVPATVVERVLLTSHGEARHAEQEARIDAIVARLDAFAGQHARIRPFARRWSAGAEPQYIDHAVDDGAWLRLDAAGARHRADLDALAAARTGVEHGVDAFRQSLLERVAHAGPSYHFFSAGADPRH